MGQKTDFVYWIATMPGRHSGDQVHKVKKTAAPLLLYFTCSQTQLALAWCLKNGDVSTVITGASRVEQVEENFAALSFVDKLTPAVMAEIDVTLGNKPTKPKDWGRGRKRLF